MDAPLAGLLVADLTQNVAGPTCTQILGDMGAEVVKVERPGRGDDARAWAPPYWGEESATFMSVNRNKRSLAVDMKQAEGRAVLERLIARADVLVQSLRAGAVEELGLGWERANAINPRLVYCSVTAFGTEGPLSDRPGYDPLMQALGGIMSVNGHPGQPPARVPVSIVDMGTGMWAAIAILGALRERDRTGRGANVTTALYETALAWSVFQMNQYFGTGEVPAAPGLGHRDDLPVRGLPHARCLGHDRRRVGCALREGVRSARHPRASPRDPRFADNPARVAHRAELFDALSAVTRALTSAEVLDRLQKVGVPCAPILTLDKVAGEPQTEASGMLVSAKHPRLPDYRAVGLPIRWDGERPGVSRVPPLLGEHTAEVLAELGYDQAAIKELASRHVIQL